MWWNVIVLGTLLWYTVAIAVLLFRMIYRHAKSGRLKVVPLSPDGQGGLALIGSVAFALTLMPGCGVVFVLAWFFMQGADTPGISGSIIYFIVLTLLFFVPLWSVHDAMQTGKGRELTRLSNMYRRAYERLPSGDEEEAYDLDETRSSVAYLSQLDRLYKRAESMPVWPFDMRTIWQFLTLVFGPAVLLVVQKVAHKPLSELVEQWLP